MISRRRNLLAAVLAVQIVFAIWTLGLVELVKGDARSTFAPAQIAPSAAPIDIEQGAAIAEQHIRGWSPSARLVAAVMRVEWSAEAARVDRIELPQGGWLVFTFADGDETMSIYLDRRTGIYITSSRSDYGDDVLPAIDLSLYLRSSTTAALTAEVLHGSTYRTVCPSTRTTAVVAPSRIINGDGSVTPIWTVTYADTRFASDIDVLVQVDAVTGNVIRSEAVDRPCQS